MPKFCFDSNANAVMIPAKRKFLRNNNAMVSKERLIDNMTGERKLICEGPHQRKISAGIKEIRIFFVTQ